MNTSIKKIVYFVVILLLITVLTSFAYFTANITGSETDTTLTIAGGSMNINYEGGSAIVVDSIYPKEDAWINKSFTLIGNNTTTLEMHYTVVLKVNENTFRGGALQYKLASTNTHSNGEVIPSIDNFKSIAGTKDHIIGDGFFVGNATNASHTYVLSIYFPETNKNQNYDQGKSFKGYVEVKEHVPLEIPDYYVMASTSDFRILENFDFSYYDDELDILIENYVDTFQYIGTDDYIIIPEYIGGKLVTAAAGMFGTIYDEGWNPLVASPVLGVATTNNNITNMHSMFHSTSSEELELKYLDTSSVTDMSHMFNSTQITNLDLSSFNTSNVTNMNGIFTNIDATEINLTSFDTSNVTSMMFSFEGIYNLESLDLSSFDTSNVTNMSDMFMNFYMENDLDLTSFNTSSVTTMYEMFYAANITSLNLTSFDTSSVTTMESTFYDTRTSELDLSSFDTSNVEDMTKMFNLSQASIIDVSSFNTSNVITMKGMFCGVHATTLDVSSFNTSKVTNMESMFESAWAQSLDLSNFDTSNVTDMSGMFYFSIIPTLDLSGFDTSKVTNVDNMFKYATTTTGYAKTQADANKFNGSLGKPVGLTFTVK